MLVLAAIVPHPPQLLPTFAKQNLQTLAKTKQAFLELHRLLYASQPEALIFISPHTNAPAKTFSINQNTQLTLDLKDFGELTSWPPVTNQASLGYRIREQLESSTQLILTEESRLDYGTAIPLIQLRQNLEQLPIVSLGTASELDLFSHYQLGQKILKPIDNNSQRLAVIASADLTRTADQPDAGSQLADLDRRLLDCLRTKDIKKFLNLETSMTPDLCGLRPIAVLLGLLKNKNYNVQLISYERNLEVGYALLMFNLG